MSEGLHVSLRRELSDFDLDIEFDVPARGVTALFGPSGAGKTTILRCIAGLDRARGSIRCGDAQWQDGNGVFVPTHRRRVGLVFQEPSLFPHLDVRRNLHFGLDLCPPEQRRIALDDAVAWLALDALLNRRPDRLSGGERKRVAMARAVLASPRLLLMDEPMAGLDDASRREILPYIERLDEHLGIPVILVSHRTMEVLRLADHVVRIDRGRVAAIGDPTQVLLHHAAEHAGEELGSVLRATVAEHDDEYGLTALDGPGGRLWIERVDHSPGTAVSVEVPARDISIAREPDAGSILNVLEGKVESIEPVGRAHSLVLLRCADTALLAQITRKSCDRLGLAPGQTVHARVKSASLMRTGER